MFFLGMMVGGGVMLFIMCLMFAASDNRWR